MIRSVGWFVVTMGVYGSGIAACRRTSDPPPPQPAAAAPVAAPTSPQQLRTALFAELQPVTLGNCTLERFGEKHDGGYLLCGNLLGDVRSAYSYGISGYDGWGCQVSRRLKVAVHQYDCFDLTEPVCKGGRTVFHAECVGTARATDTAGRVFDTPERQCARNGDGDRHLAVKMDVEGAEWDTLLQMPDAALERIDQLVVEFHGVARERFPDVIRRLKRFFYVANLHFNNYSCAAGLEPFPAWAYEVLFVSRRLAVVEASSTPRGVGDRLDARNDPRVEDCQSLPSR